LDFITLGDSYDEAMGWTIGVPFPAGPGNFSLRHLVQTVSGVHPALYPMGIGDKATGAWRWPLISI